MKTYAFIDASNLQYGGSKSLGWSIDYQKLAQYLKEKYQVNKILYYGGVEIHTFPYSYLENDTVPLEGLEKYLNQQVKEQGDKLNEAELLLIARHIKRIRFYRKLEKFGYELCLKPVKLYDQDDGTTKRKANCDVELAFHLVRDMNDFDRVVILSGDGDFLPLLKYLKEKGKEVFILARAPRTAKEIKQFAGGNFRDFIRLESHLKYESK